MNKTKILVIFTLLLLVSTKYVSGQKDTCKFNLITTIDTIQLNVRELEAIDDSFEGIIINHLRKIKSKNWLLLKKKHLLLITIEDPVGGFLLESEKENKYQKFVSKNYGDNSGYHITCRIIKRNSVLLSRENLFIERNIFYYNYKNLDVLLLSNLNIEFSQVLGIKNIEFIYEDNKFEISDNGKYSSNEILHMTFITKPKKYENLITNYKLLNHALYSIEYRNLYE